MSPFFSIIIPTYNTEQYIERCLESCINQTFKDIEIIVIDDCSNDNSLATILHYSSLYPQIHIIKNDTNLGTFLSRIEGIKQAKGQYTLFLDSDDLLKSDTCFFIYEKIIADYKKSGVYTELFNFGLQIFPSKLFKKNPPIINTTLRDDEILETFFLKYSTPPWSLCTKAFRTNVLKQTLDLLQPIITSTHRLTMAEDALMFFAIALKTTKSIGYDYRPYFYFSNPKSITQRYDEGAIKEKKQSLLHTINMIDFIPTPHSQIYIQSKNRFKNILKSVIELEVRHKNKPFTYPIACIKSLKYHQKWQTYLRIALFFLSFGKIKL